MNRSKTFPFGGIRVDSFRSLTENRGVQSLSLPSLAVVPLVQYHGARATWVVAVGESIREEQLLAKGLGPGDLDVHSPTPGILQEFREVPVPGGGVSSAALIRLDGSFNRTGRDVPVRDWSGWSPAELLEHIRSCGVYLESSTLDKAVRLPEASVGLDDLVINGLQPEPYLTLALALLDERSAALAEGIEILRKIYSPLHTLLVTDRDDTSPWQAVSAISLPGVELVSLEYKFPQAQAGLLAKTLSTGPRCLIIDVNGVLSVRDAVVEGRPQIERTVVLSGQGARHPGTYRVRIGTPLFQFLKDAGGIKPNSEKIVVGGPFQGRLADNLASPIVKSTQAVLVLAKSEVNTGVSRACIRCGSCVKSCPVGLEPLNLYKLLRQDNVVQARNDGLDFCIGCGICSFVCPSRLPLVETFQRVQEETSRG